MSTKNGFVFTSNRDETTLRAATAPQEYLINNCKLFFPKDPLAGGTWYAANQYGNILVLLNGAEEKHEHKPPYNQSRGQIVLEIISNKNPFSYWQNIGLQKVEPFTIVLFQDNRLYQLRWNETHKSELELSVSKPHIWSSSTLYNAENRHLRAKWFLEFLETKQNITADDMLDFHSNTHAENTENGLIIDRNGLLKTLSITQSVISKTTINMNYTDLINVQNFSISFEI